MAFRAAHAQWGAVFAHLPDLGCGQAWGALWKVRPPAPLTCDECGHPMYAKVSRNGLRFFAHAPGAPNCALALETLAHHMLKLELANAARDAGAHAEMEARGPDGTWRADVLASDPAGSWRIALEAQLAPITAADITARTDRMRADGVTSIWFSDRQRPPWLGVVPSVRLARPDDGGGLVVAEGLVKFDGSWASVPASLVQFLGWVFTDRIVPHRRRHSLDGPAVIWTAPDYIRAEAEDFAELERQVERDRLIRAANERRSRDRAWQERQFRQVVHALQTGDRFPAGTWGATWTRELWPLRHDLPAVRAIWAAAIEASGGQMPGVTALWRARQEYEQRPGERQRREAERERERDERRTRRIKLTQDSLVRTGQIPEPERAQDPPASGSMVSGSLREWRLAREAERAAEAAARERKAARRQQAPDVQ
jgi:hypothetical protein